MAPTKNLNATTANISSAMIINRLIMLMSGVLSERFLKLVMDFFVYETYARSSQEHG